MYNICIKLVTKLTKQKKTMKAINVKSNLGFTYDMKLDLQIIEKLEVFLDFSTGFSVRCNYFKSVEGVDIYTYKSIYSEAIHYLHLRNAGDKIYGQTVQTGEEVGGCTFEILLTSSNSKSKIKQNTWYKTSRGHYAFIGIETTESEKGNITFYHADLLILKGTKEIKSYLETAQKRFAENELKEEVDVKGILSDYTRKIKKADIF